MPTKAPHASVEAYLASLPPDRREALAAVRHVILKNLPKGYQEGIQYGMIGYFVPHSIFPAGYHCDPRQPLPFASMASQKNHMALYMMGLYMDPGEERWFRAAWSEATDKEPDMGKSCVRFKRLEDLPLGVIGEAIARTPVADYVERYVSKLPAPARKKVEAAGDVGGVAGTPGAAPKTPAPKKQTKKTPAKKTAPRKAATKKVASKKTASKKTTRKKTTSKKTAKATSKKTPPTGTSGAKKPTAKKSGANSSRRAPSGRR